ncbi:bisphosphoglycerate-independent phosphoglycerate mutase (AlkP superfamily) [Aquimarina sp. EL_43]|uniref:hypothetical protein n=1 Tax=Aquimarina TaxID=290174 RepID=UPI00046FC25A|nr:MULTISPECIES: hypothetical protein [Aquimarina]MBG6129183.1 bisphosphoglycerate-independent phosphoglycerate mutase (AlkP superfamily) [Aquimarina sp. EL_35]MBG6150248.1 bisphosphoglycerate-independent phosphoglycerate mutase (AlkP superfamily) [Aquimarina sp. EL_32]MBG6167067.1 bisphosphoglycerate-independent phosphoglycerate mutase (AlkP superfamily) [Aquimarina sp. EL_43]
MKFIELTLKNHTILHGFDARNREVTEEVEVEEASKKIVAVKRILSISEKYILIKYAYDRVIYWEYMEDYETIKKMLVS